MILQSFSRCSHCSLYSSWCCKCCAGQHPLSGIVVNKPLFPSQFDFQTFRKVLFFMSWLSFCLSLLGRVVFSENQTGYHIRPNANFYSSTLEIFLRCITVSLDQRLIYEHQTTRKLVCNDKGVLVYNTKCWAPHQQCSSFAWWILTNYYMETPELRFWSTFRDMNTLLTPKMCCLNCDLIKTLFSECQWYFMERLCVRARCFAVMSRCAFGTQKVANIIAKSCLWAIIRAVIMIVCLCKLLSHASMCLVLCM